MASKISNQRIPDLSFSKKDFRVDTYRGSGSGGQHRNKTDSAVRITHIETGLSASCEEERSQHANKKKAFRKLVTLLLAYYNPETQKRRAPSTERIRTYHEPRGVVIDHRTGQSYDFERVVRKNGFQRVVDDCVRMGAGLDGKS